MRNNKIELSINLDMSPKSYEHRLTDILEKYKHKCVDPVTIGHLRYDIHGIIEEARNRYVDISEYFPILIAVGAGIQIRIFQTGDIYIESDSHIAHMYKSYKEE